MKITEKQKRLIKRTFIDYQQTSVFLQSPLIMHKAKGLYYWDIENKKYFDAIGGIFVATLGHRHPRVTNAIKKQLDVLTFSPPLHSISDITLEFIETLGSVTPGSLNFIKSYSGGSESIESAIKFTRQYFKQTGSPAKYKFISCYHSYHGSTFGAMSASGTGERKTAFEPLMAGFIKVYSPLCFRDRFPSWDDCNKFAALMIERTIINEDPNTVAGIILEPISNTGGIVTPTIEYFEILRRICDKYNIILIFDEIITGYGKTGFMFAAQTFGVVPDIICSGKGLSSGTIPIGAMIAKEEMSCAFLGDDTDHHHFSHGHTYAGNPLACAAGIAVIDEIVEKKLDKKAGELGMYLNMKLENLKKYDIVKEVRGKGTLQCVELVRDTATNNPFPELSDALKQTSLRNGLIMRINPTWFVVSPALIAEKEDIDIMCDLIEKSVKDALDQVTKS